MEGAEKTGWHTTSGSRDERATKPDNVPVSRIRLGWTSKNMGNFCESQPKILVEEYVQRYSRVHGKLREVPNLLRDLRPRSVTSDILTDNQLQMDGRHCSYANRDRTKEVLGASSRRSHKPSRRSGAMDENMFYGMPISFGRSVLQVWVCRTSDCGSGRTRLG